jgi:SagB-type dehydrogenase family enzyme
MPPVHVLWSFPLLPAIALAALPGAGRPEEPRTTREETVALPPPGPPGRITVEEALEKRRSVREYTDDPVSLGAASRLLWAAQGITGDDGERTAPSAGALYPIELYLAAGNVEDLSPGLYKYRPATHALSRLGGRDLRKELAFAALGQDWVGDGAAVIVVAAVYERTTRKYGDRGVRYVHMEVGHVAQNIYLQAAALGLGTTLVGAFHDDDVARVLGLPDAEVPLAILPIGRWR